MQLEKPKREIPDDITYMWNLKRDTNEPTYETGTGTQRQDWWLPRGWGVCEGLDWESAINRYKLEHKGWKNKVLLNSTENCSQ